MFNVIIGPAFVVAPPAEAITTQGALMPRDSNCFLELLLNGDNLVLFNRRVVVTKERDEFRGIDFVEYINLRDQPLDRSLAPVFPVHLHRLVPGAANFERLGFANRNARHFVAEKVLPRTGSED